MEAQFAFELLQIDIAVRPELPSYLDEASDVRVDDHALPPVGRCQILYILLPVSYYNIVHYYYIIVLHYYSID